MSEFIDRLDAIKVDLETAVAGITVVTGYKDPTRVNAEDFPFATVFNPTERNVPGTHQQVARAVAIRVIYVRAAGELALAATDLDAMRDELESAPLLAGSVTGAHRVFVTDRVINETVDETGRLRAAMVVVIEEEA